MAKNRAFHFAGLPSLRAKDPTNAARRAYGPRCYAVEVEPDLYRVCEDTEYYGTYLLGYMVRE